MRVLIVDDEESIRFGLSRTLARRGHEVATAASGADARREAAELAPDVVLLDLRLPDEDGLALLHDLAATERAPRVVVMTGYARPETAEAARARGAAAVLHKPVDIDGLLRLVDSLAAR